MRHEDEFLFLSQEAKKYFLEHNKKEQNHKIKEVQSRSNIKENKIIANGSCGDNINWSLKKDGRLVISGAGNIDDMKKGKETVNDWDDYHEMYYRDWYPEYRDGVCINLPNIENYIHTVDIDTVPWRDYRDKITCVDIAEGIVGIGGNAFSECCYLSSVHLPDTIKTIGKAAFKHCDRLIIKRLPSNLTYIGDDAFLHSDGYTGCLVSRIPSTLNYIGDNAFYAREGNKDLKSVALSEKLTHIGKNAFRGCSNMSLSRKCLPSLLSCIGENAFGGCWNLRQIVLPDGLVLIDDYAFADCHNLTDVKLSNTLNCIGESAFSGCRNIQEIEIPSTIKNIKNHAFENCVKLEKVLFKGEFPKINSTIYHGYAGYGGYTTMGQHEDYLPFAGTGCVHVYCKVSDESIWSAITSYSWGAKKMYWHRVC